MSTGTPLSSVSQIGSRTSLGTTAGGRQSAGRQTAGQQRNNAAGQSAVLSNQAEQEAERMIINVKGLRHTVYNTNGDEYTGGWKGSKKEGKGTYKWKKTKKIYEGNWKDDLRNGFGTLIVPKPEGGYRMQYSGEWKDDKRHGHGSFFITTDIYYEGEWENGKKSGFGVMYYEDGTVYEGRWKNGKRHGPGSLKLPWGDKFEGEFENEEKNGPGCYYYVEKGQVYEGVWKDGVAKCGELKNYDRDAPEAPNYELPVVELEDVNDVLKRAKENYIVVSEEIHEENMSPAPGESVGEADSD